MAYRILVPPPVQRVINTLAGRGAGIQKYRAELERDPCSPTLGAYRLSGPLELTVCGLHLDRGFRLAFTMLDDREPTVVVLYVGERDLEGTRGGDIWRVLHDLFGVENPPSDHDKPPCCGEDYPRINDDVLDDFIDNLRRLQRGR